MKYFWNQIILSLLLGSMAIAHPEVIAADSFITMEGKYSFADGAGELKISVEREVIKWRVKKIDKNGSISSSSKLKLEEEFSGWFAYVDGDAVWIYNGKDRIFVVRPAQTPDGETIPTLGAYGVDAASLKNMPVAIKKRIPELIAKIKKRSKK